jgi:hypothetical protein
MPGRKRTPATIRELKDKPGHRPIPAEPDFTADGEISKTPNWLDK